MALHCPAKCGSTTFRVTRRGAISQDISIGDWGVTKGEMIAEAGGWAHVSCSDCGWYWKSRSKDLDDVAYFMESR